MRTPAEHLGNHRLAQLLHEADALGLARTGFGSATGTPLPAELATRLAAVVGADLSRVRLHRGERAAAAAAGLGARAYTLGTDVVLGARAPDLASAEGRELIAHEAVHVVQQQRGLAPGGSVEAPSGAAERVARDVARRATTMAPTAGMGSAPAAVRLSTAVTSTAAPVIQRDNDQEAPPPGHGAHLSPEDLVNEAFWHHPLRPDKFADEVAGRAFWLTWQGPAHYPYVEALLERMSSYDLDDSVARDVVLGGRPEDLDNLAATPAGRRLLDSLSRHLITGNLSAGDEQAAHLIEVAKARRMPVEEYIDQAARAPIFPVRQMGITRIFSADAPLSARRLPDGRIWVKLPNRVLGMDMFAEETATLPYDAFSHGGLVLNPDDLVGIRDYDAGGEVEFLPATALLVMGSKSHTSTLHLIGSTAAMGASLGVGGAGVAAESTMGRALLWADRAATAIGALGTVIGENRDWAIRTFGADFVHLVDVANNVVAVYGIARLAGSTAGAGAELVQSIRRRWQDVRASGRLAQLRAADATTARLVGELDRAVEQLPPPSVGQRIVQHLDEWAEEPKGGLSSLGAKEADDLLKEGWKRLRKGKGSSSPKTPKPAPHTPASKAAAKASGGKRGSAKRGGATSGTAKGGSKGGGTKRGGAKTGAAKKPVAKAPMVTLKANVLPHYPSKPAFMAAMRRRLLAQRKSGKPSPLDFLLGPDGQWRKGMVVARSGRKMRGRYALSDPDLTIVQAGHMQSDWYAKAMGRRDYLMLEDADLNWMSGAAEAAGAVTNKPAVLIDGYPVDLPTARLWESHGALPRGTVSAAPVIEPPPF